MSEFSLVLARLAATIEARKGAVAGASYTAQLLADPARAAKKLGEEAVETALAAVAGTRAEVIGETADLLYHLLVVLRVAGVGVDEVMAELASRTGRTGLEEKAARPPV